MTNILENLTLPGPTITPVSKPFWEAVARCEFILQKCGDCNKWVFYPRSLCPHCWGVHLEWKQATGNGRLKTWSIVHKPGHPSWTQVTPYVLGIVELEEGPSMLSHLRVNSQYPLEVGLPLRVCYQKCNDVWLPFFEIRVD
jgi:uncharacterized protein